MWKKSLLYFLLNFGIQNEIELIAPVITSVLGIWVSTMTNNQLHLLFFLLGKLGLWLVSLMVAVLLAMNL